MKITSRRLTIGGEIKVDFVGQGTLMVKFPAAENVSRNVGTEEEPEYEDVYTSWFTMVAFGETAQQILDNLEKGDAFELVNGWHSIRNIGTEEEPDYRNNYKINEFKKIEKSERSSATERG